MTSFAKSFARTLALGSAAFFGCNPEVDQHAETISPPSVHKSVDDPRGTLEEHISERQGDDFATLQAPQTVSTGLLDAALTGMGINSVCSSPFPEFPQPKLSEREEQTLFAGNAEVGTVVHFGQIHFVRSVHDPLVNFSIGRYQLRILSELLTGDYRHVFLESLEIDCPPGDPRGSKMTRDFLQAFLDSKEPLTQEEARTLVRELFFPDGKVPENPDDVTLVFAAFAGAGELYALLKDDVTLHHTLTHEEANKFQPEIDKFLAEVEKTNTLDFQNKIIFDAREECALRSVRQFLEQPEMHGSKVALIFGEGHRIDRADFARQAEDNQLPEITRVTYPQLKREWEEADPANPFRLIKEWKKALDAKRAEDQLLHILGASEIGPRLTLGDPFNDKSNPNSFGSFEDLAKSSGTPDNFTLPLPSLQIERTSDDVFQWQLSPRVPTEQVIPTMTPDWAKKQPWLPSDF